MKHIIFSYINDAHLFSDVNECLEETDTCPSNTDCLNTEGSYVCLCRAGYTGDGTLCHGKFLPFCFMIEIICLHFSNK